MNARYILLACRVLLALVFLLACLHKILVPEAFALAIYRYQILPDALINVTAITLPWIELVAAVSILAIPRFKQASALLMFLMLGVFAVAMSYNLLRGLDIECGCFSAVASAEPLGWENVIRNLGYMFLAGVVLFEERIQARLARRSRAHGRRDA